MGCNNIIAFSLLLFAFCAKLNAFEFEYPYYTGTYAFGNVSFENPINVLNVTNNVTLAFELSGDDSEYFRVTKEGEQAIVILLRPVPDANYRNYILIGLSAREGTKVTRTVLHFPLTGATSGNCFIDGIEEDEYTINIVDTDTGTLLTRRHANIKRVNELKNVDCNLNDSPYITASVNGTYFTVDLMSKFRNYEANETTSTMSFEIKFDCDIGFRKLKIVVKIRDTNNHSPTFLPNNNYNFTILTPIPRGFPISFSPEIIVRDNDLTNYEMMAQIQDNIYFNVSYVDVDKTGKNYKLLLTAKTDIARLPNPISVFIFATDRDLTGYPPFTSFAQITVDDRSISSSGLKFEYDLNYGVFDNEVDYVRFDHELTVIEGHTPNMKYWLNGMYSQHFDLVEINNVVKLVTNNISLPEGLFLNAERMVFVLYAENNERQLTSTTLNFIIIPTPNCELNNYNPNVWEIGINVTIPDTFVGDSLRINTRNVIRVENYEIDPPVLNFPPYIHPVMYANRLDFEVDPNHFAIYERHEFAEEFTMKVTLKCLRNTRVLSVTHKIIDSNNFSPTFVPEMINEYDYNIYTPVPANFYVNMVYGDLVFRDVDLTNYGMTASISNNDFFTVTYSGVEESYKKQHRFNLITKKAIDSIPGKIVINITVTDMDRTGDLRRSVRGVINIISNVTST